MVKNEGNEHADAEGRKVHAKEMRWGGEIGCVCVCGGGGGGGGVGLIHEALSNYHSRIEKDVTGGSEWNLQQREGCRVNRCRRCAAQANEGKRTTVKSTAVHKSRHRVRAATKAAAATTK